MRAALTEAKNAGKGIELDVDSENPLFRLCADL